MAGMAIRQGRTIGVGIAGVVLLIGGLALAATRPPAGSPATFPPIPVSPTAPTPAPIPSASARIPIQPRSDSFGNRDDGPRSAIESGSVDRSTMSLTAIYDADVRLAVRTGKLHVATTIIARNDDTEPIDRIELNSMALVLAPRVLEGVTVDGNAVEATIDGQTIIVPLAGVLPSGASVRLTVAYRATIDDRTDGHYWLFTRSRGYVEIYRWLPWVSRVIAWPHSVGEALMTPVSPRVRVRLRTDRPVVVGASGQRVGGEELARDFTFTASNVRDFNLIVAENYRVATETVGDVEVRVLTRPGGLPASAMMANARTSLPFYGERLGAYPYPTLTIAESAAGYGMESPAMVWIPRSFGPGNRAYTVPHEIAHQWFYSLVGNDQALDPFFDEAITDFMARDLMGLLRAPNCAFDHADGTVYEYEGNCYFESVYVRGSLLFDSIRDDMGNDAFWGALREYVDAHRNGFGTTRGLFDALDAATDVNLRPRIEALLPSLY
jgi:hypothetical protein